MTIIEGVVNKKSTIFEVFRRYLGDLFFVLNFYRVLATDIKGLTTNALVTLERRLKVPNLAVLLFFEHFFFDTWIYNAFTKN